MNFRIIAAATLLMSLTACDTAQMQVKNSLTERGFVATRDFELGQVLHWLPEQEQLLPVAVIDRTPRTTASPVDLRVSFASGAAFVGGVNLTPTEQASLEAEVNARTSTVLQNAVTRSLENVVSIVIADWNARPQIWLNELGIADRGWPVDDKPIFLAMVYKQTLADRLQVQVDSAAAVGGEFTSSVQSVDGNVKFELVDAASIELIGRGDRTPVFYDFAVIRIRNTEEGPKFSQVTDPEVRAQLASFIVK